MFVRLKDGCVSLNWFDYDDRTCLHVAASDGNIDILKRLLEEDSIDINKKDRLVHLCLACGLLKLL